jgi:nicotinate dehydrogenase subunit B
LLSKAVGRPVRVQGMRYEGHAWDPKGPASIHRARAALGQDGAVSLAGQLMGSPLKSLQGFGVPAESYGFANKRLGWETIAPLLDRASPLRTAHLRDPVGPRIQFGRILYRRDRRRDRYGPRRLPSAPSEGRARHRRR